MKSGGALFRVSSLKSSGALFRVSSLKTNDALFINIYKNTGKENISFPVFLCVMFHLPDTVISQVK